MMTLSDRTRGTLMAVVGVTVLSFQGLLIRQVSADSWTLICLYGFFMFLSLSIGLIVCWRRRAFSRFRAIGWTGVIAAAILAVNNILFISGITLTSIANTLVIVNSSPLLVALLSWLVLREKVPGRTWIAILVGLGGIGVIFHGSLTGGSLAGDLCAFGAAASFAVYLIFLRHARDPLPCLVRASDRPLRPPGGETTLRQRVRSGPIFPDRGDNHCSWPGSDHPFSPLHPGH